MPQLETSRLREQQRRNQCAFIAAELDLGTTFATIALSDPNNLEKRERNECNARRAYEEASRFMQKTQLASDEREILDRGMRKLRSALNLLQMPLR
jgi:hypothetical protein